MTRAVRSNCGRYDPGAPLRAARRSARRRRRSCVAGERGADAPADPRRGARPARRHRHRPVGPALQCAGRRREGRGPQGLRSGVRLRSGPRQRGGRRRARRARPSGTTGRADPRDRAGDVAGPGRRAAPRDRSRRTAQQPAGARPGGGPDPGATRRGDPPRLRRQRLARAQDPGGRAQPAGRGRAGGRRRPGGGDPVRGSDADRERAADPVGAADHRAVPAAGRRPPLRAADRRRGRRHLPVDRPEHDRRPVEEDQRRARRGARAADPRQW